MPDRRRVAVVVTPLLALLAALLAGWSVAAAQAPDPLTLTITASRAECTAGTLNPVTWTITGGTPPYTLTLDGMSVDADAESATVTCGALPEGATRGAGHDHGRRDGRHRRAGDGQRRLHDRAAAAGADGARVLRRTLI